VLGAGCACGLIALGVAAPAAAATAADPPAPAVVIHADGSVAVAARPVSQTGTERGRALHRFSFGLPRTPPKRRQLEENRLPIGRTEWETNGIRYTQIVLLTRLEPGELMSGGELPEDAVLLVQVLGENTASEYTEATAEFSVQSGGGGPELELRESSVIAVGTGEVSPLAMIEVPATGIAGTRGPALQFRGAMPPGTSGSMTLKIPVNPLSGDAALNRLRELEFDEEFRRVKRFWTDQLKAAPLAGLPIAFAPEDATPPSRGPPATR